MKRPENRFGRRIFVTFPTRGKFYKLIRFGIVKHDIVKNEAWIHFIHYMSG